MLLARAGYQVVDLGVDISWERFIEAVATHRPAVLAISSAIDVDLERQERARKLFDEREILDHVTLVIGGGGFSKEKAAALGALAYAGTLADAVQLVRILGCMGEYSQS